MMQPHVTAVTSTLPVSSVVLRLGFQRPPVSGHTQWHIQMLPRKTTRVKTYSPKAYIKQTHVYS